MCQYLFRFSSVGMAVQPSARRKFFGCEEIRCRSAGVREGHRNGYFACVAYSLVALIAVWFPFAIAILTALFWTYWLAFSVKAD